MRSIWLNASMYLIFHSRALSPFSPMATSEKPSLVMSKHSRSLFWLDLYDEAQKFARPHLLRHPVDVLISICAYGVVTS